MGNTESGGSCGGERRSESARMTDSTIKSILNKGTGGAAASDEIATARALVAETTAAPGAAATPSTTPPGATPEGKSAAPLEPEEPLNKTLVKERRRFKEGLSTWRRNWRAARTTGDEDNQKKAAEAAEAAGSTVLEQASASASASASSTAAAAAAATPSSAAPDDAAAGAAAGAAAEGTEETAEDQARHAAQTDDFEAAWKAQQAEDASQAAASLAYRQKKELGAAGPVSGWDAAQVDAWFAGLGDASISSDVTSLFRGQLTGADLMDIDEAFLAEDALESLEDASGKAKQVMAKLQELREGEQ